MSDIIKTKQLCSRQYTVTILVHCRWSLICTETIASRLISLRKLELISLMRHVCRPSQTSWLWRLNHCIFKALVCCNFMSLCLLKLLQKLSLNLLQLHCLSFDQSNFVLHSVNFIWLLCSNSVDLIFKELLLSVCTQFLLLLNFTLFSVYFFLVFD